MQVGLHFWGQVADGTWTNICHDDTALVCESMALMKETIDIAARNSFQYVNIHPSNRAKCRIDFEKHSIQAYTDPLPEALCERIFTENALVLHEYAKQKNVVFIIETAPHREVDDWTDTKHRNRTHEIFTLDTRVLIELAKQGVWIANDFGHTGCAVISDDRRAVCDYLFTTTNTLAPQTRLIHLGFIVPPYSGTDFHDQLYNPIFDTDAAVPNKQEIKQLLQLFSKRNDIWILAEPNGNHPQNYELAKELIRLN